MKKFFHYAGNIAAIFLAFVMYNELQVFYFYPRIAYMRYHLYYDQALITTILTVIVMAIMFWLYKRQLREVNYWGFNQQPHWDGKRIGIAIVGFFLIFFLGAFMILWVNGGSGRVSTNQENLNRIATHNMGLFKIMVGFIGPFCEEVIFRGMFFNTFFTQATKFNKWTGILVSGFVFAFLHDPRMTKFILVYWVLGCVLAWVYMTTKDLRYSMITHMAYNCVGIL